MANEIGNTEVSATIQAVISQVVQDELKQRSIYASILRDESRLVGPGMNSIAFPKTGSFTAESKSENTALNKQVLTFTNDVLALDQYKAILVSLEDIAGLQAKPSVVEEVIKRMASEMVYDLDAYLHTKLILASASAPDHRVAYDNSAGANTLGKVDIINARTLLNKQFAPMDGRFLSINPDSEKHLLSIDDFVHVDKYGASAQGLSNGELGKIYGFTVVMSNVPTQLQSVAFHRDAVVFARQQQVKFETQRDIDNLADKYAMSQIYGAKELQGGKHQVLIGSAA